MMIQRQDYNFSPIDMPLEELGRFCERWNIRELALFGSALREDFGPESDLDFLVTFAPDAKVTLFDLARAEQELSELVGRPAELVSRRGIERSANWIRRDEILNTARTLYAA